MAVTRSVRFRSVLLALSCTASLGGCAYLPASGPTAGQIQRGAQPKYNDLGFKLINVDQATVARLKTIADTYKAQEPTLSSLSAEGRNDVVGPGDVLSISVYEVGVALFGGSRPSGDANSFDPSARAENFQSVTVDGQGDIRLPYTGTLTAAGHTIPEIQEMIANAYRGKSQNPQVVISLKTNVSQIVYVSGEVRKPGTVDLTLRHERLLDAIATAGGTTPAPEDTVIRFDRGGHVIEERFDHIRNSMADDLPLIEGDRIEVIKRPRSFLVAGATTKVAQISFETSDVSLAEALARVGGPTDSSANPAGIFVFRYERAPDGSKSETPIIYRINMLRPESYFLAQRFAIQDKDLIYISNSASNRPSKFVSIINQLLSPFLSVRAVTN